MTSMLHKVIASNLTQRDSTAAHIKTIGDEALRLAQHLTNVGAHTRICATDFLLIRVARPDDVKQRAAAEHIHLESLSYRPQLSNYLRYQIQSARVNSRLLKTFDNMPSEWIQCRDFDRRAVRLTSGAETVTDITTERYAVTGERLSRTPALVAETDI
jgi:histidinol-phosphate/aromatic aminotransferase/cobyric acid decarboxylase-like protein